MQKNRLLMLSLLSSLFLGESCEATEIRGSAFVGRTAEGAQGVLVSLIKGATTLDSKTTGADGSYIFKISELGEYRLTFKKVAHRIIVPETTVMVGKDAVVARQVRVFRKDENISVAQIASTLQERSLLSNNDKSIEEDLMILKKYATIDAGMSEQVKKLIDSNPQTPQDMFAGIAAGISAKELVTALGKEAVTLIDLRNGESYKKDAIPTAVSSFDKDWLAKLPKDKKAPIVLYGTNSESEPGEAHQTAKSLQSLGYLNLRSLRGGIEAWKSSGN